MSSNLRREAASCVERGIERYAEGQYAAAQRELEQALSLHPGHPRALECLAWVREIASGRRAPSSDKYAAIEADEYGPAPLQPTRAGIPTRSTGTRIPSLSSSQQVPVQTGSESLGTRSTHRTALGLAALVVPPGPSSMPMEGVPMSAPSTLGVPPAVAPITPPQSIAPKPAQLQPVTVAAPTEAEMLPELPAKAGATQLDDAPESVTREWSSMGTSNLPQLDVPELSEEQIANLLDLDRGQGFTLSAGKMDTSDNDADDSDEVDRTNVRTIASAIDLEPPDEPGAVYEMVAEPEDEDSSPFVSQSVIASSHDPVLTPLSSAAPIERAPSSRSSQVLRAADSSQTLRKQDQTSDDAPSLPTNPFVQHALAGLAPLLAGPSGLAQLDGAFARGDKREIFELAEQLAERGAGGRAEEDILVRAYERVVGRLDAVPRYGKAAPDLDSRSAFMLSRMDGEMTVDDLLDVSGMSRRDALRILARLVHAGSVLTS